MNRCVRGIKLAAIVWVPVFCTSSKAVGQERDSGRVGIHQLESQQHAWDDLQLDRWRPEFQRGKEQAILGHRAEAEAEFRKGIKANPRAAWFNLGLTAFHYDELDKALRLFRRSWSVRHTSVCNTYMQETKRLIKERKGAR